jgi:dihydroxyacid dehydratase/phosphogluconate dehydratase
MSSLTDISPSCPFSPGDDLHIEDRSRAGGIAQVIKHLPSKCETLSSNPIVPKKEKTGAEKQSLHWSQTVVHLHRVFELCRMFMRDSVEGS